MGTKREQLPRARNGLGQGLLVGGLLCVGVVGVFALIGLPLVYGASRVAGCWRRSLVFGIGYGVASLGCSLPVFPAFLAASLLFEQPGG